MARSTSSRERTLWARVTPPQPPAVGHPTVLLQLVPAPQGEDRAADLEEHGLLDVLPDTPAEPLVEGP